MVLSPPDMYADVLKHDLCAFIHRAFLELNPGTPFFLNWHIEMLASKLEEVRAGTCRRLIINVPPRHLKSHAASIAFPAWLLGHSPAAKVLCISYGQDLADDLARQSRDLMSRPFYEALFDTRISPDKDSVRQFETIGGGRRISSSTSGAVTGRGADFIIIDDPLKADEALSESARPSLNTWYDNTLRSRLNNQQTGAIIIVMQRLHSDDLVAHVQEHETWDVLSFPMVAEQEFVCQFRTPYGIRRVERKVGDILQPSLVTPASIAISKQSANAHVWHAQYQQDPQPAGGVIVKREWLKFYGPYEKPEQFDQIVQSWDTANKETELADYSVCTTWGRKGDAHLYLLDVFREKLDFPKLKQNVRRLAGKYAADTVLVEDKVSGTSLIQEMWSENFSIIQAAPHLDGSKEMRLHGQTARFAGGFVLLPAKADWLEIYLQELLGFPNSKTADQVDSTVYALAWSTLNSATPAITQFYQDQVAGLSGLPKGKTRFRPPIGCSQLTFRDGRKAEISPDGIVEVSEEDDITDLMLAGFERLD